MIDEKLSIRINICDRYYPLVIERKDEEKIRKASKLIGERLLQYRQKYVDKDNQDYLAMTVLQFATQYLDSEAKLETMPIIESLKQLNDSLDQYIEINDNVL